MKTIKIIDLLNKIANGEEAPEKFRYVEKTYERIDDDAIMCYICTTTGKLLLDVLVDTHDLRDNIEILDEEDEFEDIEKIDYKIFKSNISNRKIIDIHSQELAKIKGKINQLIKNQKKIISQLNKE